jgi:DNA-binding NarL/FixJ family response regulator
MHRLAVIEDQTAVREMLVELLESDGSYELVGQCGDGREALGMCLEVKPDLVVLDAMLPGLGGAELLRRLVRQLPGVRVLVFSGHEHPHLIREMLEAGAKGFVEKTANFGDFKKGLAAIALGGTYFGPSVARALRRAADEQPPGGARRPLTDREREILQLVAKGHSTKEVAAKLGISAKTADNHRTNLMRKLDIHDTASLTRHAIESGLLEAGRPAS